MKKSLFLHGGPGFCSHPEKVLLMPELVKIGVECSFWNEPSRLRPDQYPLQVQNAFGRQVESLGFWAQQNGQPEMILCHSYGMFPALKAIKEGVLQPSRMVLISSVYDLNQAHRRILKLAERDFTETNPEAAKRLSDILRGTTQFFDQRMQEGLGLATTDTRLLNHYWRDKDNMTKVLGLFSEPQYQFDGENFLQVLSALRNELAELQQMKSLNIPLLACYGSADPIAVKKEDQKRLSDLSVHLKTADLPGGHWAHLENADLFARQILEWLEQ